MRRGAGRRGSRASDQRQQRPRPSPGGTSLFLKALAQDRRNPEALSGLGHCCFRLVSHPYWLPNAAMLPPMIDLGREAVRAALAVASDDVYAHCVDGMLSSVAGNLERPEPLCGRRHAWIRHLRWHSLRRVQCGLFRQGRRNGSRGETSAGATTERSCSWRLAFPCRCGRTAARPDGTSAPVAGSVDDG